MCIEKDTWEILYAGEVNMMILVDGWNFIQRYEK